MEVIKNIDDIKTIMLSGKLQIVMNNYSSFYYNSSYGNCKHCVINSISYCQKNDLLIDTLNKLFKKVNKLCFTVNVTNKKFIDFLSEHFELIDMLSIPIGYGNEIQYHAIYFTNNSNYHNRNRYVNRVRKQNKDKKELEFKIKKEDLLKIKDYKMDHYRNKFIDKLLKN